MDEEKKSELSEKELEILENCREKHLSTAKSTDDEDVYFIKRNSSFVVFRCPRRAELQAFKAQLTDDRKNNADRANADWKLAAQIVLHPTGEEQQKLFSRRAMLLTDIAIDALAIAADAETKSAKKFESGTS